MNQPYCPVISSNLGSAQPARNWIWEGYLARGKTTLFTSLWKSGKTTLLAHLISQRRAAGSLAGKAVTPGASIIVSEEGQDQWQARNAQLNFGPNDHFYFRPFAGVPTFAVWQDFMAHLTERAGASGCDLVVIDPLARFLPAGAENNAALMLEAFAPLDRLALAGVAILLLHHPRKAPAGEGLAARGCGALSACVDFLMEMRHVDLKVREDRRRRLIAFSRDAATPRSQIIELDAAGLTYATIAEPPAPDEFSENWPALRMVFEDADRELTRDEILAQWPTDYRCPKQTAV